MMKYYTYIIQSRKDSSYYIGYTSDIAKRLEFHNSGESKYTSKKMPWMIVYYEIFGNKSDAIKRERFLKKQRNREFFDRLIKSFKEP